MHPMLNIAIRAVRKGGSIIVQNYDTHKFTENDINQTNKHIKKIQYKTYKIVSETIYRSYPQHIIINNINSIKNLNSNKNIFWIIKELDGTNNFTKNFPHFCISILVIIKSIPEISVIYDPLRNDLFSSVRGQGAQLNGYRTRCSDVNVLNYTTIAINIPLYNYNVCSSYFQIYKNLISSRIYFRHTGSTILDLAYVSSGRIDCIIDFNFKPINLLIGRLQTRESGCLINNFTENNQDKKNNSIYIISSPKYVRLITEKLQKFYQIK